MTRIIMIAQTVSQKTSIMKAWAGDGTTIQATSVDNLLGRKPSIATPVGHRLAGGGRFISRHYRR
jgi:hypothetical protein